ncbi:20540_t:CDS:1 [Gigaspora margarita]|uniref:20540_t:CDS:1 n=1 Tax=Gigaspora margarita TaxID=4874 RepID=A0ABN7UGH5_GIGMA|nr:20540_t:CDS:1 [Gigaspora margarita]
MPQNRLNVTRACDPCRKRKAKCVPVASSVKCKGCIKRNIECTDNKKLRPRGPKPRVKPVDLHEDDISHIIRSLFPEGKEYFPNVMSVEENCEDEIFGNLFTKEVKYSRNNGEVEIFRDLSTEEIEYCGNTESTTRVDPSMKTYNKIEGFSNGNFLMPVDTPKEIYEEDEVFYSLSAEEIEFFNNSYTKEQLNTFRSFTPLSAFHNV